MRRFECQYNMEVNLFTSVNEELPDGIIGCDTVSYRPDDDLVLVAELDDLFGMSPNEVKKHFADKGEETATTMDTY